MTQEADKNENTATVVEKTSIQKAQEARPFASYENVGRKTIMTPEVINKLEQVFALDGTVKEACFFAEISHETYYNFLEKNPEYRERFEALRNKPVLKARQTLIKSLDMPKYALKYLERKKKNEFGNSLDLTTGGETFNGNTIIFKRFDGKDDDLSDIDNGTDS